MRDYVDGGPTIYRKNAVRSLQSIWAHPEEAYKRSRSIDPAVAKARKIIKTILAEKNAEPVRTVMNDPGLGRHLAAHRPAYAED